MADEPITVAYITGKTVKASIRRDSDGFFLDFTDGAFKAAGWTTRYGAVVENATEPGLYRTTVNPASWTAGIYQVTAVDAAITTRPLAMEQVSVVVVGGVGTFAKDPAVGASVLLEQVPGAFPAGSAGYKLGLIGTGEAVVVAPVLASGDIRIKQGDDYVAEKNRALEWTDDGSWPSDITNYTVLFGAKNLADGGGTFTKAGSVVTATGASKRVRVELTSAETAALAEGAHWAFDVQLTSPAPAHKNTRITGAMTVDADYAA